MSALQHGSGLRRLRSMAVGASLFAPTTLAQAVSALGFVQYDPVRAPARAQDLILHQRVRGYRSGDLDRHYDRLGLEEDYLHVYGAMPHEVSGLLQPRPDRDRPETAYVPAGLAARVLAETRERDFVHPRDLAASFGRDRAVNDWGGVSAATTRALEELHYHGLIRVAGRDNGVKVYRACERPPQPLAPDERLCRLTMHLARMLAPIAEPSLRATLAQLDRASGGLAGRESVVADLLRSGALACEKVDGVRYLWPTDGYEADPPDVPRRVRFLAPFDPVVWDRRRFEHLWGWAYRFEAYTPRAKRRYGYYALPMLFGHRAIGWVTCTVTGGALSIDAGFASRALTGRAFRRSFDQEAARLETMLKPRV